MYQYSILELFIDCKFLTIGEIELERLPLKCDLLKQFGLPLEASSG